MAKSASDLAEGKQSIATIMDNFLEGQDCISLYCGIVWSLFSVHF